MCVDFIPKSLRILRMIVCNSVLVHRHILRTKRQNKLFQCGWSEMLIRPLHAYRCSMEDFCHAIRPKVVHWRFSSFRPFEISATCTFGQNGHSKRNGRRKGARHTLMDLEHQPKLQIQINLITKFCPNSIPFGMSIRINCGLQLHMHGH